MPTLLLDGHALVYILRRSARRRTVGLLVDHQGLTVTAPTRMPVREIEEAIERKAAWVRTKLARSAELPAPPAPRTFVAGEALPYRGGVLTLATLPPQGARPNVRRNGETLEVRATPEKVEAAVRAWYLQEAAVVFAERLAYYAPLVGKAPRRVTIKDQRRRWGSCSSKGDIALNWRLLLAPPDAADFVVAHELCHLHRMDHSAEFWALVAAVQPSYEAQRAWLRDYGPTLAL
ncbi:MAG: SprT family zinc-dependent metalloprotease [Chloroflexi bacterium]|nr:SprT family zinc-dependent metalloprotease [Chloroflexota bacterium]